MNGQEDYAILVGVNGRMYDYYYYYYYKYKNICL